MVALLLGGGKILPAVLADVAEMLRSALSAVHWEAVGKSIIPSLLGRGTMVSDGIVEPLQLSLMFTFAYLPVSRSTNAPMEGLLAPAAHEDAGIVVSMAPLVLAGLLGRVPLAPPPSLSTWYEWSARSGMEEVLTAG